MSNTIPENIYAEKFIFSFFPSFMEARPEHGNNGTKVVTIKYVNLGHMKLRIWSKQLASGKYFYLDIILRHNLRKTIYLGTDETEVEKLVNDIARHYTHQPQVSDDKLGLEYAEMRGEMVKCIETLKRVRDDLIKAKRVVGDYATQLATALDLLNPNEKSFYEKKIASRMPGIAHFNDFFDIVDYSIDALDKVIKSLNRILQSTLY